MDKTFYEAKAEHEAKYASTLTIIERVVQGVLVVKVHATVPQSPRLGRNVQVVGGQQTLPYNPPVVP